MGVAVAVRIRAGWGGAPLRGCRPVLVRGLVLVPRVWPVVVARVMPVVVVVPVPVPVPVVVLVLVLVWCLVPVPGGWAAAGCPGRRAPSGGGPSCRRCTGRSSASPRPAWPSRPSTAS
ncbi:hypothetical protein Slala02_37910 [Streptomyces lavendulae subsp. lavendulae]|nr:hypothetical protein Slala01_76840 [Streptomyces lavendulae subsp. lavendulae]GLX27971.1 hypothetical protein Slala02_37910 [Streptomyces lavendulae subsp. lavendulae]